MLHFKSPHAQRSRPTTEKEFCYNTILRVLVSISFVQATSYL